MSTDPQIRDGAELIQLRVVALSKRYSVRRKPWGKRTTIQATNDVSFEIPPGKTLGLVGSSGSGKSTVARCVTRLERPDAGEIWLGDTNIASLRSCDMRPYRSQIQMIFQDPATAMNPKMSAAEIIEEPLLIQGHGTRNDQRRCAADLMREVGLSSDWLDRRITDFSGGQRQRIAIARALTLKPKVLVLDEALSNLDVSTQWRMVELLQQLQVSQSLSYLLISHDLALVARMAEHIAILSGGRILEQGSTREVISNPTQTATRELVRAAHELRKVFGLSRGASA
jgi:peptide/nickel transport system ATP-binding protein